MSLKSNQHQASLASSAASTASSTSSTSTVVTNTSGNMEQSQQPQQPPKPMLSPTRSLDEGFESDPDRVSTDSEHPIAGVVKLNSTKTHKDPIRKLQQSSANVGSNLAQLSSAASGGWSVKTGPDSLAIKTRAAPPVTLGAPQIIRRPLIPNHSPKKVEQKFKQGNSKGNTLATSLAITTTSTPTSSSSPRLQYQRQRQPMVSAIGGHSQRYTATNSANTGASNGNANANGGLQRTKFRVNSANINQPTLKAAVTLQHDRNIRLMGRSSNVGGSSRAALRSRSVDAVSRHRQGYDPSTALLLRHEGNLHHGTRMQHYGVTSSAIGNVGGGAGGLTVNGATSSGNCHQVSGSSNGPPQALLVQPISSVTLSAGGAVVGGSGGNGGGVCSGGGGYVLSPSAALLNSSNINGDAAATAALVAAVGGTPVIASATHSLYTFYPAEGNLQVWQTECGDLTYKSSRPLLQPKTTHSWTQSIPRQTRR